MCCADKLGQLNKFWNLPFFHVKSEITFKLAVAMKTDAGTNWSQVYMENK